MVTDLLESYRIPGEQTDLAGMTARCGQLGSDPGALFGVVQGLVLHEYACEDADTGRHDLDAGAFRSAGRAWLACRRDGDDPGSYGIGQGWGWPELRGSLLSDAAALVKDERFTFDRWELAQPPPEPDAAEDAWLDWLAELTLEDERIPQLRELMST